MALEESNILKRTIDDLYLLKFDYPEMNVVMRIIKEHNLNVIDQQLALDCKIFISVRKKESETIFEKFSSVYKVEIKELEH
jgi:putative IMPACT (imprinted ancient) family translation regulator